MQVTVTLMILLDITCPTATASIPSCDFELGFCTWIKDLTDDFDWTRDNDGTPSRDTGPSIDHTTQTDSGYYIHIETSWEKENATARIISCPLVSSGSICVSFWYHMYGEDVNTLNVYKQDLDRSASIALMWTKIGDQGNRWINGQVDVSVRAGDQIVFEGIRGKRFRGDIALDDIMIIRGSCSGNDFVDSAVCADRPTTTTAAEASSTTTTTEAASVTKTTTSAAITTGTEATEAATTTTKEATTMSATSTTSAPATVSTVRSNCRCQCNKVGDPTLKNITTAQLMDAVKQLKEELAVDQSKLSSTIRKKTSAPDERPSSKGIGALGIVMLTGVLCLLLVADSAVLVRDMKRFLRNVRILRN